MPFIRTPGARIVACRRFRSRVGAMEEPVTTLSGWHNGMRCFPYATLYVALLIGQAVATMVWVAYGLM
jgi:hypothetical protein